MVDYNNISFEELIKIIIDAETPHE